MDTRCLVISTDGFGQKESPTQCTLILPAKEDFPFSNLAWMKEQAARRRKCPKTPRQVEEEVTAPFALSPSPSPAWPPTEGQHHC